MVEFIDIQKTYDGKTKVIENLNLKIEDGELLVLVGESGCGKTTTMQMLNKLIIPTHGKILIDGKDIREINSLELRRSIGYVIQDVGLFPHWTIEENVATVRKLCGEKPDQYNNKIKHLLDLVDLDYETYAGRYPRELSGGQKQRVGVARALANNPKILLMDEPFSALDPITREQLQNELLKLHEKMNLTIIFVTHDIDEAIKLGDRIAVMQNGKAVQLDSPEEILKNPKNDFVAQFVGKNRLWKSPDLLSAEDVMNSDFVTIRPDRSVAQAIEIMKSHNTTILCVGDRAEKNRFKLQGLIGANRLHGISDHSTKMAKIMKTNLVYIKKEMSLVNVMQIRDEKNLIFSPVIDEKGYLIGIITDTSILNVLNQIIPGKEDY